MSVKESIASKIGMASKEQYDHLLNNNKYMNYNLKTHIVEDLYKTYPNEKVVLYKDVQKLIDSINNKSLDMQVIAEKHLEKVKKYPPDLLVFFKIRDERVIPFKVFETNGHTIVNEMMNIYEEIKDISVPYKEDTWEDEMYDKLIKINKDDLVVMDIEDEPSNLLENKNYKIVN